MINSGKVREVPLIQTWLDNRHSLNDIEFDIEGHGRYFPDTRLILQVRKINVGGGVGWSPGPLVKFSFGIRI